MKKTREDDSERDHGHPEPDHLAEEISGACAMGMRDHALELAKRALRSEKPSEDSVLEAIFAVLVFNGRPLRWRNAVEATIARLPEKSRYALREVFVNFFAGIGDAKRGADFAKGPGAFSPQSVHLAVECLVRAGEIDRAKAFLSRAMAPEDCNPDTVAFILEARARVASVHGDNDTAMVLRNSAPFEGVIMALLAENRAKNAIACAIQHLDEELEEVYRQKAAFVPDERELVHPGMEEARFDEVAAVCRRWRRRLRGLLDRGDLYFHGLCPLPPKPETAKDSRSQSVLGKGV